MLSGPGAGGPHRVPSGVEGQGLGLVWTRKDRLLGKGRLCGAAELCRAQVGSMARAKVLGLEGLLPGIQFLHMALAEGKVGRGPSVGGRGAHRRELQPPTHPPTHSQAGVWPLWVHLAGTSLQRLLEPQAPEIRAAPRGILQDGGSLEWTLVFILQMRWTPPPQRARSIWSQGRERPP